MFANQNAHIMHEAVGEECLAWTNKNGFPVLLIARSSELYVAICTRRRSASRREELSTGGCRDTGRK